MKATVLAQGAVFVPLSKNGHFTIDTSVMSGVTEDTVFYPGDYVKVVVQDKHAIREKFWCKFISQDIESGLYKLVVNNDLLRTMSHGLDDGDEVLVPREMLCIYMSGVHVE